MDALISAAVVLAVISIMVAIMAPSFREKVVDLIAQNLREPKGFVGRIVRVSWTKRLFSAFYQRLIIPTFLVGSL